MQTVEQSLQKGANNLDLARLLLAAMVIYGHSFSVTPSPDQGVDLIWALTGYNAGDLAIKGFFCISGLLVTNSLIVKSSPIDFVVARAFRILPALIVVTIVVALVIGPAISTESPAAYFSNWQTWDHIWKQATLQTWGQTIEVYSLPGVFVGNPVGTAVNAPLWSIAAETYCYALLLVLALCVGTSRIAITTIFAMILLDTLLPEKVIFRWLPQDVTDFAALPVCFAFGSLLAAWKSSAKITPLVIFGLIGVMYLFGASPLSKTVGYAVVFLALFWLCCRPWALKAIPRVDISYGLYLWGWPIQQVFAHFFPGANHYVAVVACISMAAVMGYLSAVVVEAKARAWGRSLTRSLHGRLGYLEANPIKRGSSGV